MSKRLTLIVLMLIFVITGNLLAQDTLWTRYYDGTASDSDIVFDMMTDAAGNTYVLGNVVNMNTFVDIALIKYDSDGNLEWSKEYASPGAVTDEAQSLMLDEANNCVYFLAQVADTTGLVVVKYDLDGNFQWEENVSGEAGGGGRCLAIDQNGDVYVALIGWGLSINKISSSGTWQWAREDALTGLIPNPQQMRIDADNNLYIVGYNQTGELGFLVKLDSAGYEQWKSIIYPDAGGIQALVSLDFLSSGNIVAGGGYIPPSETGGYPDLIARCFTPAGDTAWTYTYGDSGLYEWTPNLKVRNDTVFVVGLVSEVPDYGFNTALIALSSTGGELWSDVYNRGAGIEYELPHRVALVNDRAIIPLYSGEDYYSGPYDLGCICYSTAGVFQWAYFTPGIQSYYGEGEGRSYHTDVVAAAVGSDAIALAGITDNSPSGNEDIIVQKISLGITAPYVIQVTNLNDAGEGSLRWAIDSANNDPAQNHIEFTVSGTIMPDSLLPALTDDSGTYIYGSTAPGKAGSVVINGSNVSPGMIGLTINSPNNIIEGLEIRNCIDYGIVMEGSSCRGNLIINNSIISNRLAGIDLRDDAKCNQIGGYSAGEANIMTQNGYGIRILSDSNIVIGNQISITNVTGRMGVWINGSSYNLIDSNSIYNKNKGIGLSFPSFFNTITRNKIYQNDSLGIDLNNDGVTVNDAGDGDIGANELLNFPEIDSVYMNTDSSFIVYGTAAGNARVEFFVAHPAGDTTRPADSTGYGEAYTYLGYTTCTLAGDFNYTIPASAGLLSQITATATDTSGNTSEFCENFLLTPRPLIVVGYSYGGIKYECPSNIDLRVVDPDGNSIGYDTAGTFYDDIPGAEYHETAECNDSVYIADPLIGTYNVEVVGEPDALPDTYYGVGIRINGSDEVIEVVDRGTPPPDSTDSYEYDVEENWHYMNGDANRDSTINIFDITFIITYLYLEGAAPWPEYAADANCDLIVNIFDITHLINYLYRDGDEPCWLGE